MAGNASAGIQAPPNSFGSVVVNGQLVGAQTTSGYFPSSYGGGVYAGPALSPVTAPPSVGYGMGLAQSTVSGTAPTGSVPGANSSTSASTTNRGSTSNGGVIGSPAMWALAFMVIGVLWLRFVHWRKPARRD